MAVCEETFLFLPAFGQAEQDWPNGLRIVLYMLGLMWIFVGVAIISDIFMNGIERICSQKKRVKNLKTGRTVTVMVWNATVANLTLMALGSSAPEIMLSVIEVLSNKFYVGDLGAGTIIGSAAFNLLMITAVSICALPDGEVRYIKDATVYAITATFSVFAYLWLLLILQVISPNVVEIWEGVITFLFFPVMLVMAFIADKGYFRLSGNDPAEFQDYNHIPDDVTKEELAEIEQQIREEHQNQISDDDVIHIMHQRFIGKPSRATYRHAAIAGGLGRKKSPMPGVFAEAGPGAVVEAELTYDAAATENEKHVEFGFGSTRYAFLENCKTAKLQLCRTGIADCGASVQVKTREGTAKNGDDYEHVDERVDFAVGEIEKTIEIKICDDVAYEEAEEFYVDLSDPQIQSPRARSTITISLMPEHAMATVVIIDDDHPGLLRFVEENMEVEESFEDKILLIPVERCRGASGIVGCSFYTEDASAVAGYDYLENKGDIKFQPAQQTAMISITIKPRGRYDRTSFFYLFITDPKNGAVFDEKTDGGEDKCVCHVTIKAALGKKETLDVMASKINWNKYSLGYSNWKNQFKSAIFPEAEEPEDGEEPEPISKWDWFVHFISMPWKLIFAVVPPVDYFNGWATFLTALAFIGLVTATVGDMANLVGCVLTLNPEITAITFVALGTSLPDTFASKRAAQAEPYADACVGNVTGSNAVNVFLGLGLPWMVASIYWACVNTTDAAYSTWMSNFLPGGIYHGVKDSMTPFAPNPVFVVPAGSLWFNLMVFSVNATVAIAVLYVRRKRIGGELGGPKKLQYVSAAFLVSQWLSYISLSSMWVTINAE
ncbi:unnamed protein product [Polarella glacialis]|uniref:Calx-beta domain-containing protein n=1 Tax=Polarella glacialis TaxID=89957 RepID=A0A813K372_POLGL|nr:unnamed protein product [Polarella glacialis]CAE8692654.1 unnamed protein product [Polarella glacialis]